MRARDTRRQIKLNVMKYVGDGEGSRLIPNESTVKSSNDDAHNAPSSICFVAELQSICGMTKGRASMHGPGRVQSPSWRSVPPVSTQRPHPAFQRCTLLPRSPNHKHASSSCTAQQIDNEGSKILSHLYVTDANLGCSATDTQRKDIMSENKLIRFVHHKSVGQCPILVLEHNSVVGHVSFILGFNYNSKVSTTNDAMSTITYVTVIQGATRPTSTSVSSCKLTFNY